VDHLRFDSLIRALGAAGSRRQALAAAVGGLGTLFLAVDGTDGKKKKKKPSKKKKQRRDDDLPRCLIACDEVCCTAVQPACCHGTVYSLCYDPATESCCPDLGGQFATACPPQTRCEFFDDPNDTLGPASFCCPSGTTKCGLGCCPDGSVCCPGTDDSGYAWSCCPDASCDEVATECSSNGDHVVDARIF
jgi:hypothetical protein